MRITTGVSESGIKFEIRDDWIDVKNSHRKCDESWTGITTFIARPRAATVNSMHVDGIQFRDYIRTNDGVKHEWGDFD